MNNTLKNRIEAEARSFADRIYPPSYPQHSIARAAFAEGAKYALSHQWIGVDEALPEESDVFLIVHVEICTMGEIVNASMLATYACGRFSCESNNIRVTRWMPIPEMQKEQQQ